MRKPSLPPSLSLLFKLSLTASSLRTLVSLTSSLKVYKSEYPLPSAEISRADHLSDAFQTFSLQSLLF